MTSPLRGWDYLSSTITNRPTSTLNTYTFIGDSIANGSGSIDVATPTNTQVMSAKAFTEVANYLTGHQFQLISPANGVVGSIAAGGGGVGFALGGTYTDDMISGGYMAAAAASAANVIIVHIGTNNCNRGDSSAKILADLLTIWRIGTFAGKRVIATTILPRDNTTLVGAKLVTLNAVNVGIRALATAEPGVYLCDWHGALLSATGAAPPPTASTWFTDGLHPNPIGAWRMGTVLAPVLASVARQAPSPDHLMIDPGDIITPNPIAAGNVAGVATSWTVSNVGAPTSVTPTKVARSDLLPGEWQQVACVAATATTDGYTITVTDSTSSDWTIGDIVYAFAEIQADAAGWDSRVLQLDAVLSGTAFTSSANLTGSSERTASTAATGPAPASLTLVTPRITVSAGVTAIRAVARFYGSGTVRFGRVGVRKVAGGVA